MWLVRERELEEENRKHEEQNPQELNAEEYQYKISLWLRIKHSRMLRGLIMLVLVAITLPMLILIFLDLSAHEYDEEHTCIIRADYRIPCGPPNSTLSECLDIYGCWDDTHKLCFHSVPSQYQYRLYNSAEHSYKPKTKSTPFGGTTNDKVYLIINKHTENKLSITLHTKAQPLQNITTPNTSYNIETYPESMSVEVSRKDTSETLLSTSHGPTIVSNRYWEWSVDLNAEQLFGLDHFRFDNETVTKVIYKNANDHSSVARFMAFRNGTFHGLTVDHTGPLEVTVLPSNLIILRMLSGEFMTLHLAIGPTPYDVVAQQRDEGLLVPPYWALGVHLCRDGTFTSVKSALEELNMFHQKIDNARFTFPYDTDCIHEHLFSFVNSELSTSERTDIETAIDELKTRGKRFVMTLAPQVSSENPGWQTAIEKKIVYTNRSAVIIGKYLGKEVIFPDYSLSDSETWFQELYNGMNVDADSFVLRSNWPENDQYDFKETRNFQYISESLTQAMSKTLPWDSLMGTEEHINKHNAYGCDFARVISSSIANPEEKFIMSASYQPNCNTIAHVQNVNTTWVSFKKALTETLSHSISGAQLFSVPVCGSTKHYVEQKHLELCMRWYLSAATMPVFRITSELPRRDPTNLRSMYLRQAAIDAIKLRYTLLPYFYTTLSTEPGLLIRPMFFDFNHDNNTLVLDEQYMVGDSLLVVQPVVAPIHTVKVYLPKVRGGWFEFWGGNKYATSGWNVLNLVESDLVMFAPAGTIIPMQNGVASNAEKSRVLPLKLAVVLECSGNSCHATGYLRAPDSYVWKFDATEHSLQVSDYQPSVQNIKYLSGATLKIYGTKTTAQHYTCTFINVNTKNPYCNYTKA